MKRDLFRVMAAFGIVVGPLSCEAANRLPKPHELEINPHKMQHQIPTAKANLKQTVLNQKPSCRFKGGWAFFLAISKKTNCSAPQQIGVKKA
jgi:hypothetical protein